MCCLFYKLVWQAIVITIHLLQEQNVPLFLTGLLLHQTKIVPIQENSLEIWKVLVVVSHSIFLMPSNLCFGCLNRSLPWLLRGLCKDCFTVGNYLPLIAGSCQFVKGQTTPDYARLQATTWRGCRNWQSILCLY